MAQQQTISADELFKPKASAAPQVPPGGVSADTLFGGASQVAKPPVQQAPVQAQQPSAVQKPPVQPPQSGLSPVQKAVPFSSGLAEQSGLDPARVASYKKPTVQAAEVTKQLVNGMSDWIGKTAKDPYHITDPFEALARGVEFHVGGHDPFGIGNHDTPIDEIAKALKSGDTKQLEHASGRFVGALTGIAGGVEAKEAGKITGKLGDLSKVIGTDVPRAANKPKLVAAANDTLEQTRKQKTTEMASAIKTTRDQIGQDVKVIADADRTFQQSRGTPASSAPTQVANLAKNVADIKAGSTPLLQTKQVLKALQKYGQNMSWEDLKDFRSVVDKARQAATGKDLAVLGKTYNDLTKELEARAGLVGKGAEMSRYAEKTKALTEHSKGIVRDLGNAKTGLDFFQTLGKNSNQPRLNAFASTVGLPKDFFSEAVKSHEPITALAKSADGPVNAIAGRLQALAKHPLAVGATGAATMMAPIPAKYIVSLWTMGKAGELMDRLEAATALRKVEEAKKGMTGIPGAVPPSGGVANPPGNSSPFVGGNPNVGPSQARGQGVPRVNAPTTPNTAVAPQGPLAQNSVAARIAALTAPPKAVEAVAEAPKIAEEVKTEPKGGTSGQENVEKGSKAGQEKAVSKEEKGKVLSKAKAPAPKAYEKFGVSVDTSNWKTPEDVSKGKAAAHLQLQQATTAKAMEIREGIKNGSITPEASQKLSAGLVEDAKKARLSIDKIKTPQIGRIARDRIRKGNESFEALADVGKQQASREAASGDFAAEIEAGATVEKLDKLLREKGFGKLVDKITDAHFKQHDGEYVLLAKQLQAMYDTVSKKK